MAHTLVCDHGDLNLLAMVHYGKTIKRSESRKSHSWWWDSHITPKNSKWLMDNLEEMDQSVKQMLKMIEEDADSFAKKAEMYYQKRPVLISHVEDFYRLYRSLAERYDCLTGELRKNVSSDLQSQSSSISDILSEPSSTLTSPDHLIGQRRSSNRAAGFDFFLGSGGSNSDIYQKEGDGSSCLTDSEPESDDSSVKNYATAIANDRDQRLSRKMMDLEIEHPEVKEKFQMEHDENANGSFGERPSDKSQDLLAKIVGYEEELRIAHDKERNYAAEIMKLKTELQQLKAETASEEAEADKESSKALELDKKVCLDMDGRFKEVAEELKITKEKLNDSEKEISRLKLEMKENRSSHNLQDQFEVPKKETGIWKAKLNADKREVSKLQERIARLKTSLTDRDHEIRDLKTAVSDAEQKIFPEKAQLKAEIARLSEEVNLLKELIRDWECRGRSSEEEIKKVKREKAEEEERLKKNIVKLEADLTDKSIELKSEREKIEREVEDLREKMGEQLEQLIKEGEERIGGAERVERELRCRLKEMEEEIEKQRVAINEGAEEKREVIRQLCFSLEHCRKDYHSLRQAFKGHKQV